MKKDDSVKIFEAYQNTGQRKWGNADYFADALIDPKKYILTLDSQQDYDHEGNTFNRAIGTLSLIDGSDYENVCNADDLSELVQAFEDANPEGLHDNR